MENPVLIILSAILIVCLLNLIFQLLRKPTDYKSEFSIVKSEFANSETRVQSVMNENFKNNREELSSVAKNSQELLNNQLSTFGHNQSTLLNSFQKQVKDNGDGISRVIKESQEMLNNQLATYGKGQSNLLTAFQKQITDLTNTNQKGFNEFRESISKSLGDIRVNINNKLELIQKDNNTQLEKMRVTVDEKLQKTLEERLGHSFQLVNNQLKAVQEGLGEMRNLASDVGGLKKVLSNVKTRGSMGEIQLENILSELLTQDQYGVNVSTIPGSGAHVEFAIKFPGKDRDGQHIWLPIDSKFPMETYEHYIDAYESGDKKTLEKSTKDLVNTIKKMAKDISTKYVSPPHTTDFGVLFLPTEGLYADEMRQRGLFEQVQREYKIIIAGPSNLSAFINSLQMGFRSIAIEKRSSEVWKVLSSVKTEFGKFGVVLNKVKKKLNEASNTIDQAGVRTRAIQRNLRDVEIDALPSATTKELPFDDGLDIEDFNTLAS